MRIPPRIDIRSPERQSDPPELRAPEQQRDGADENWREGFEAPTSHRPLRPGWRQDCGNETQGDELLLQHLGAQLLDAQGMPNLELLAKVTPTELNVALHLHAGAMQRRNLCRHDCACVAADITALEQEVAQLLVELDSARLAGTEAPLIAMMTRQHTLVNAQLQRAHGLQVEEQDYLAAAQSEVETGQARLVEWLSQEPAATAPAIPIRSAQAQPLGGLVALLVVPGTVLATVGATLAVMNVLTLTQLGDVDSPRDSAPSSGGSLMHALVVAVLAAAGIAAMLNTAAQRR